MLISWSEASRLLGLSSVLGQGIGLEPSPAEDEAPAESFQGEDSSTWAFTPQSEGLRSSGLTRVQRDPILQFLAWSAGKLGYELATRFQVAAAWAGNIRFVLWRRKVPS